MNFADKAGLPLRRGLWILLLVPFGAASEACHISASGSGTVELTDASEADSTPSDISSADGLLLDAWQADAGVPDAVVNADVDVNLDVAPGQDMNVASDGAANPDVAARSDGAVAFDAADSADAAVPGDVGGEGHVRLPEATDVLEGDGTVEICVQRAANLEAEAVVVSTKQLDLGNGEGVHPAAAVGVDYLGLVETLNFAGGQEELCFNITIVDNSLREGDAELGLGIVSAEVSHIQPGQNWYNDLAEGLPRVTILEDDTADCSDGDNDGYGQGQSCLGLDCDDTDIDCWTGGCCPTDCTDNDTDGYGSGADCLGLDCDDADVGCWSGACCEGVAHWPLEMLQWDMLRAHPGVHYSWRFAVKGGVYPYRYTLITGPTGMTVDPTRGVLSWDPPMTSSTGNTVRVRVTDTVGATLEHAFDIEVTADGFYFVDGSATGGDGGPGTQAAPWQTVDHASANAGSGFVYVRAGTYAADGIDFEGNAAHRWLAYPGERPVLDLGGGTIGVHRSQSAVVGLELQNAGAKMFWAGGRPQELIWRDNIMHGAGSTGWNNPAFVFFEDGDARPAEGRVQYDRIVVQDNHFYDLTNPNNHGSSVNCFNCKNLLYEDNEAHDIDGPCVLDKDDGYFNTFRHNVLHDCNVGVALSSQYSQAEIEVSHNLIYNVSRGVGVGAQPGYIRDIYIHHNIIDGASIIFGSMTDCATCGDFEVYRNVISAGSGLVFETYPVSSDGGYRYPAWVNNSSLARFEDNLLWTTGAHVVGYSWGLTNLSWSDWRGRRYDVASLLADPELGADHKLPVDSPYLGLYGRD